MADQRHTPGPWVAKTITDPDTNCLNIAVGTPPKDYLDNFDTVVCLDIRGNGRFNKEIREVAEANAHLIAAAPELLKTLIDLVPYIKECEQLGQIHPIQAQAIREVVTTALAKAEPTNVNPKQEE